MSLTSTRHTSAGYVLSRAAGTPSLQAAALLFLAWWLLLAFFYSMPQIDLAVARAFFTEENCLEPVIASQVCGGFSYSSQPVFVVLRQALFYTPHVCAVGLIILLVMTFWPKRARLKSVSPEGLALLLGGLLLGPIALVNLWLKAFSGRPRPYQTDLFGGDFTFVPAGVFGGECISNCSFISGEAAGAGWIICLIALIPTSYRMILAPPIIAVSLVTPALRVAFGGHYLSDVVLGWWSSLVVVAALVGVAQLLRSLKKHGTDVLN